MNVMKQTIVILVVFYSMLVTQISSANEIRIAELNKSLAYQTEQVSATVAQQLQQSIVLQLERLNATERHVLVKPLNPAVASVNQADNKVVNSTEE